MENLQLLNLEDALKLTEKDVIDNHEQYINPALTKMMGLLNFNKQYVKARGTEVWDSEGNKYLDFLGGYGALNFGHNPPEILKAIRKIEGMPNILQTDMKTMAGAAAYNLSQITPGDLKITFFGNSGTEAVEGAIKLARIASGKEKVIYCEDSFHGKTMGSLSVTGRSKYQKPFRPLVPANKKIPFGDLKALEERLKEGNVAAFIVEPIQGEGGIILPPKGYLKKAKELCNHYSAYFILDEVQTGFGRTGKNFACEHEGVVPDIMCLAKSLGGGIMPVGAFITTRKIWNKAYGSMDKALLHTSTFGGNTMAATAVLMAINLLVEKELSQKAAEKGDYFLSRLTELADKYNMIKEVRGKGLMIGLEFKQLEKGILNKVSGGMLNKLASEYTGSLVAGSLLNDHQVITAYTLNNPNVIRMEPPLTVSYDELDYVLDALETILEENKSFFGITIKGARTALGSIFNR